jgi:CheY-like chemotaxis protein
MKTSSVSQPDVLLINRSRDGLLVRSSLLKDLGYRVAVAQTGEEGLKLFEASAFDVVVADYRMPRMNGVELIERIRKVDPQARVILLSGQVEVLALTTENTGADAVLAKSANEATQLARSIKRLLNRPAPRKPPASQTASAAVLARADGR